MSDLELIDAAKNGAHARAKIVIENVVNVNQQGEQGWTPLNFAAGKEGISMVKLLVENGADVFKVGRDQRTRLLSHPAKYLAQGLG
jgi:ankyrin repeat protein